MENHELKTKIKKYLQTKKIKTITITEIYTNLQIPYNPTNDQALKNTLKELVQEQYLTPIKTTKKDTHENYEKYKIIPQTNQQNEQAKEEILNTLVKQINIGYYLKHPEEYIKNKEIIIPINQFLQNPDTHKLTVNERSYKIYKDEKKLKQNEEILKKLGLTYKDLYSYDTYEPFFNYTNMLFQGTNKKILIIENKDTFWTIKKAIENNSNIYMVIYGEGKKILKSFPFIENFGITEKDTIQYFGDIDYEGINIYISLKEKYPDFNIHTYKQGYETILELEQNPRNIRTKQNINKNNIQKFLSEFDESNDKPYKEKLIKIFKEEKYIPQEVFNNEVAKKVIK